MSDSEIQAFESLAIQNMGQLYDKAIKLTRNAHRADDLVQFTFASAFCVFERFDQKSDFSKWLDKIFKLAYKHLIRAGKAESGLVFIATEFDKPVSLDGNSVQATASTRTAY